MPKEKIDVKKKNRRAKYLYKAQAEYLNNTLFMLLKYMF